MQRGRSSGWSSCICSSHQRPFHCKGFKRILVKTSLFSPLHTTRIPCLTLTLTFYPPGGGEQRRAVQVQLNKSNLIKLNQTESNWIHQNIFWKSVKLNLQTNEGVWTQLPAGSWWQSFVWPRVARRTSVSQSVAHKVVICI